MKSLALLALLVCSLAAFGQSPLPSNVYAGGVSFNSSASPRIAGTGLYARLLSDSTGTYAFTVFDGLPTTVKPFTVTSNLGVGVAQKLFSAGKIPIFAPTSAGISWNGINTGWQWNTGAMASIRLKNNWHIYPNVRVLKSSVGNGSGYQPIVGVLIGWQQ